MASQGNNAVVNIPLASGKMPIDIQVSQRIPNLLNQEKEKLYEDAMHSRVRTNQLKDDNKKLTTKLSIAEHEMNKKDKVIDDLLVQAEQI